LLVTSTFRRRRSPQLLRNELRIGSSWVLGVAQLDLQGDVSPSTLMFLADLVAIKSLPVSIDGFLEDAVNLFLGDRHQRECNARCFQRFDGNRLIF